ncbi:MAG: cytochrome-ba3 oxidase subunit [Halobacteriaceae archaeon]
MIALSPRQVALVGLLALAPVAAYVAYSKTAFVTLTVACVLLIVGSLWTMFRPEAEASGAHA